MKLHEYQWSRLFTDLGPRSLRFNISNFFFLQTAWLIETKFHVAPPGDGRMIDCANGPGYMTNMAAMPIYGKNFKKIFFTGNKRLMTLKVGM